MLAKSKLNSIEALISQVLIDMEISHEELITILKEKDKYEKKMKDNLKIENEKYKIMRLKVKIIEYFMPSKMCVYKMNLISAEGYKNAEVDAKIIRKTGETWVSMKDVKSGMGVKNICDLVLKELRGVLKTKIPTKQQISKYKITERELFEKFDNLSEKELNAKSNKTVYARNDVMTIIIKRCRGEKKRDRRAKDGFRKKLMISEFEIPACPEFEVKSKIGKLFMNEKILGEFSVKIYEIDPFFMSITKKK